LVVIVAVVDYVAVFYVVDCFGVGENGCGGGII